MKSFIIRRFALLGSLLLLRLGSTALHGQASAVDAIAFGQSGYVNTSWLNNTKATGTYTSVYDVGNTLNSPGTLGTLPPGMPAPSTTVTGSSITYTLYLNTAYNLYYIRKRIDVYIDPGITSWREQYYKGPAINQKPVVEKFYAREPVIGFGRQTSVTAVVSDDGNLTEVRLKYLPPNGTAWVDGLIWTSAGSTSANVTFTRSYSTVGTWKYRLSATDTWGPNALAVERDMILVEGVAQYDPTGTYGATYPALTNTAGASSVIRAGDTTRVAVEFTMAGAGADKKVRVSVGVGGGKLFSTLSEIGPGADSIELTTNASSKVTAYFQAGTVPGAVAGIYALAGLSFAKLELPVRLPLTNTADPKGAVDTDGDGMPDKMEAALDNVAGVTHTGLAPVSGFKILNP